MNIIQGWWNGLEHPDTDGYIPLNLEWVSDDVQMGIHTMDNGYARLTYFTRDHMLSGPWVIYRDTETLASGAFLSGEAVGMWIIYRSPWANLVEFSRSWYLCFCMPVVPAAQGTTVVFHMQSGNLNGPCYMYYGAVLTESATFCDSLMHGTYTHVDLHITTMEQYLWGKRWGLQHSWTGSQPIGMGVWQNGAIVDKHVVWMGQCPWIYHYCDGQLVQLDIYNENSMLQRRSWYTDNHAWCDMQLMQNTLHVYYDPVHVQLDVLNGSDGSDSPVPNVQVCIKPNRLDNAHEIFIKDSYNRELVQSAIACILDKWMPFPETLVPPANHPVGLAISHTGL